MKILLCGACLFLAALGYAQDVSKTASIAKHPSMDLIFKDPVTVGNSYILHSTILGEDRIIQVALPEDYQKTTKAYPVLYMVDGQANFLHTLQSVRAASGSGQMPEVILVAVHTQRFRERDLLATLDQKSGIGGGADPFLRFIQEELIPCIEKKFRTSPYRLLAGTSLGGVFVMHALVKESSLFNAYLALSPAICWDGCVMLQRTKDFLDKTPGVDNSLFLSVANEGSGLGVDALARLLKSSAPRGLVWKFEEYPEETHETISFRSTYDGLKFIFSGWKKDPVLFESQGDLISAGDSVRIEMKSPAKSIRYTLDGTDPSTHSVVYEKPLIITKPTIIKAIPVYGNNLPGNSNALAIDVLKPISSETNLPSLKHGLNYSYVEGDWDMLPDFAKLIPVKTGVATNLNMDERNKKDLFAFKFSGFLDIPEDDVYQFFLTSDDGSRFLVGDQVIVDNDGVHGAEEKSGKVLLKKGKQRISLLFFQNTGDIKLQLAYACHRMNRREVPFSAFYCPEK